ncbi:sigma-70 family RNA polymerase sigma factor [Saccharibacillus qingshengii]|uniref:sigma-70 family RNA polymerase sigma factor n=1 Tax=Saccharibacillus qingshengii TaxID=1763540 RepID=UPI0015524668|nr:sigma-70 family RNA polymerase sigma factor [Saccharibacillus qingshengii]
MNSAAVDPLIQSAINGDASAFAELIVAERPQLLRVAGYYVRSSADAEDAVQEAVYRAYIALPTLREPKYFRTWLTRIVINASLNMLERSRRTLPAGDAAEHLAAAGEDSDRRIDLLQAIAELPLKYRRVILLKYMQDLRLTDIAALLGQPLGTIKTYQNKGLKLLRSHYQSEIADRRPARKPAKSFSWRESKMEMTELLHHLRDRAKTLVEHDFAAAGTAMEPFIEDVFRKDGVTRELLFIWTKPGTEIGVSVTLTPEGDLLEYAVDPELYAGLNLDPPRSEQELLAIGERFVRDHRPDAPERFATMEREDRGERLFCTHSQYAAGIPLPRSGYWIDLHRSGFVTAFKYFGEHPEPALPPDLLTPEEVLEILAETVEMKLHLTCLHESVYEQGDDRLHLVYVPEPYLTGHSALRPTTDSIPDSSGSEIESTPAADVIPIADLLEPIESAASSQSPLELLGFHEEEYVILREENSETETRIVYAKKKASSNAPTGALKGPHTLESYMEARSEGVLQIRIDQKSGQLTGAMNMNVEQGPYLLDNRACLDIALGLIAAAAPDLAPYLLLEAGESTADTLFVDPIQNPDSTIDTDRQAHAIFHFPIAKEGVPGFLHQISISVNRTTGQINHYMNADLSAEELQRLSVIPAFSPDEAKQRLLQAIRPQLIWNIEYSSGLQPGQYVPHYELVSVDSGRHIRMIDATTGMILNDK